MQRCSGNNLLHPGPISTQPTQPLDASLTHLLERANHLLSLLPSILSSLLPLLSLLCVRPAVRPAVRPISPVNSFGSSVECSVDQRLLSGCPRRLPLADLGLQCAQPTTLQQLREGHPALREERAVRPVRSLKEAVDEVLQVELGLDRLAP